MTSLLVLFIAISFAPAEAYHFWYKDSDGGNLKTEPYKWAGVIPKIEVSVNTADEAKRTAAFDEIKAKIDAWNSIDGASKTLGPITLVTSADAFTADNYKTTWGRIDDNKVEVVLDYDFSVFEKIGLTSADKGSVNGYGPSYRKVEGGNPVIYDGYVLLNRTRDDFDWQSTVVHEFGHLLGLAHSSVGQFNSNFSEFRSFGYNAPTDALDVVAIGSVPTMHPFSNGTGEGRRTPKTDDQAGIRELYPAAAAGSYGGISGRVLRQVGSTEKAVKGANVRVVKIGDAAVQATRYSSYDNNADGRFYIGGLPAGEYKLLVEVLGYNDFGPFKRMAVVSDYEYDFPQEYYSGATESFTEALPDTHDPVAVSTGTTVINKDIKVGRVDFAFVVDDTGSMTQEIAGVRIALQNLINEFATKYEAMKLPFPTIAIVTFKDNVTIRKVSNDKSVLLTIVNALSASGGGDCPEAANAALLTAGPMLSEGSTAILFTDADSRPNGPTMAQVLSFFNPKKITLSTLLSGVCTEEEDGGAALRASRSAAVNRDEWDEPPTLGTQSAFRTFSTMTDVTTGVFAFRNKNKDGFDPDWYEKAATDICRSVFEATVALVEPTTLYKDTTMDVTITGAKTNFTDTSVIDFSNGITVNKITALASTKIVANVTVPAADVVSGDVTVTTGKEIATGGFFRVVDKPTDPAIISVAPTTGEQGSTVQVTVTGSKTVFTDASKVDFGTGIVASKVKKLSDTMLSAELAIAPDAGATPRKPIVDGVKSLAGGASFRVTAPVPDLPEITFITPLKWAAGSNGKLTITGRNTNFAEGTTVVTFDPLGVITVNKLTVKSATEIEAEISVASTAPTGYYSVTATTDGERAVKRDALEVGTGPVPPVPGGSSGCNLGMNAPFTLLLALPLLLLFNKR